MRASTNLTITVIGLSLLALIGGVAWFGLGSDRRPEASDAASPLVVEDVAIIAVHVSGSVHRPGLVELPAASRVADAIAAAGGVRPDADMQSTNLASPLRDGDHIIVRAVGAEPTANSPMGIDLNRSTANELESLPGVGPVLAERIVAFREDQGPFRTVEDLLDVPGIGEAKLAQMRDGIAAP